MLTRIFDLLDQYPSDDPDVTVFASRSDEEWKYVSLSEYKSWSTRVALALLSVLEPGSRIATVCTNRPEWNFVDMGIAMAGMVHVPIYTTLSDEEFRYILVHSGVSLVFASGGEIHHKLIPLVEEVKGIIGMYSFDAIPGCCEWRDFLDKTVPASMEELARVKEKIDPHQLVTLIYTSGSTGQPKGVMLSHRNLLTNIEAVQGIFPMSKGDRALSFLPICHITERIVNYVYQHAGVKIYYARSWNTVLADLKDSRAQGFVAVPRVLEKILESIQENARSLPRQQRWGLWWALRIAQNYKLSPSRGYSRQLRIADRKVFIHWRKALGGPKKFIACGGAWLPESVLRIFMAAGFPVHEGYGMTETSPLISINHFAQPDQCRIGSLGRPIGNVQVKIAPDGEILVKGENVMLGYFREPELTLAAFDDEGWLHTGDLGKQDEDGFLYLTGRKKDLFKTSGGKYIAPLSIEKVFQQSPLIDEMVVVGENQKFPGALILPNFEFLTRWAHSRKIPYKHPSDLIRRPQVVKVYQREVARYNKQLSRPEQIKDFRLIRDHWSVPSGELTPTLKVKRFLIQKKYEKLTRSIYRPGKKRSLHNRQKKR